MFNLFRRRAESNPADSPLWPELVAGMPLLQGLSAEEIVRLTARVRHFLASKAISTAHGLPLDDHMRLTIAAQACLPILNLGEAAYDDWLGIIVYPDTFLGESRWIDEDGLVHEGATPMSGMAREDGPILLSWQDCQIGPALDGFNVVIHECAHKLDMRTGRANGAPPLHAGMSQADWARTFGLGFRDLRRKIRHGEPVLALDAYASTAPEEFFAVASEHFFELPHRLAAVYPDIYTQLSRFYRQDPRQRLPPETPGGREDVDGVAAV